MAKKLDDLEVVEINEEVNPPNIMIDDNYGISAGTLDFALVEKKEATRVGKEEDGENCGKRIKYIKWENVNYSSSPFGILKNYCKVVNLKKVKKLKKCDDFAKVEAIYQSTYNTIDKFLHNNVDKVNNMINEFERNDK